MIDTDLRENTVRPMLRGVSALVGVLVMCLGLVVIFGWHTRNWTLVQVLPAFVPMQYNAAVGFVACGIGLLLLTLRRPKGAAIAGTVAVVLGGLTLVEYVGRIDLGIDELLMDHRITIKTSQPGRMAPNTAICFVLTGLSIVLQRVARPASLRSLLAVLFASFALGLAIVALSGYYTHLEMAYGWRDVTQMAVHTSAGFLVVSVGLLLMLWSSDIRDESWMPPWLPVPIAIGILTATLCFWQALASEGMRIERHYQDLTSVTNLATLLLIVGILLALAMALVAFLAQKSHVRARQLNRANMNLWEEIETRKQAEQALESHLDNLEDTIADRTRELEQARRTAEAANRAKSEFLSHMSHELRTPLNGILGYAQILRRNPDTTSQQRGQLSAIVNCGDHLLALINDVLDLSKIEAGRLEVDLGPVQLARLIEGVGDIVSEKAAAKGIGLVIEIAADVPPGIISDAAKLRQILVNLLGNAVKFTHEGQVTLRVAERPAGALRIEVTDTGIGMDRDEIREIFDPFKQVEAGKAAGGTGLGLAITKRLADALEATIDVASEPGKGSTFRVTLPLVEAPIGDWSYELEANRFDARQPVLAEGQDFMILVADDRETNRDVLHGMLAAAGFRTRMASDGDEVLELLRRERDVDLVLMDVRMPRVSGLAALEQIRQDESLRDLKVIAVTASVFPEFRRKALDAGFDDFLGKPFRVELLLAKLKEHLHAEYVDLAPAQTADLPDISAGQQTEAPAIGPAGPIARFPEAEVVVQRLRDALRIKNLTAIKAIAKELSADAATTSLGMRVETLVQSFAFGQIADLLDELEQSHDRDR